MRHNEVYINNVKLDEPYVVRGEDTSVVYDPKMLWQRRYVVSTIDPHDYRPTLRNWGPLVVPPDSFLVMGDNRDASYDGRYWGFLGRDRVHGRAEIIYFSHDPNGILPLPFITAIRWRRLFHMVR